MSRVIFSLYIDIPKEDLDYQSPYQGDNIPKTERTKIELAKYYDKLLACKQKYANHISVPFLMYEYDNEFISYKKWWNDKYPQITEYNIVNFYKLHILNNLCNEYDEVLYLDFDVIPMTNENFFEEHNLKSGIAIYHNNNQARRTLKELHRGKYIESIRSPTAKYWNCLAMLEVNGYSQDNDVFNTGIIGAHKDHIKKLDYFSDMDFIMDTMNNLREDEMYPSYIREMFGWDNETIWSYKVKTNEVPIIWLDWQWHLFYDKYKYVPPKAKFVHVINKNFEQVFDHYEKNYL